MTRRVLDDESLARLDLDLWERYSDLGIDALAVKYGVSRGYIIRRAYKLGAKLTGEHLLDAHDEALIAGLLDEGIHLSVIEQKFEGVKRRAIERIRIKQRISVRPIAWRKR